MRVILSAAKNLRAILMAARSFAALRMTRAALRMTVIVILLTTGAAWGQEGAPSAAAKGVPGGADELAIRQQEVAGRYQHLEEVLLRMAEISATTDPRRAALLRKVVAESKERLIPVQFENLIELLRKDQFSGAIENQDGLDKDLRSLLEMLLSENREERIESEKARLRAYLVRLGQILRQQQGIQGRTGAAGDPKQLSGQQGDLAAKTGQLAEDVHRHDQAQRGAESQPGPSKGNSQGGAPGQGQEQRPGQGEGQGQGQSQAQSAPSRQAAGPVPQRLEEAQRRMQEAQQKLAEAQRAGAIEKQEEAIRALESAKRELEEILRQLREEEIGRMLELLEARFGKMLDMQRTVYEGTVRLDKVVQAERDHSHEIEASRLSNTESLIVVEADKTLLLLRDDGTAVAFPEAVRQMREDMVQVVDRLARAKVDTITQSIERDIMAALEEMIEAVKKAQANQEKQKQSPPGQQGTPKEPPLVDVLAELKMIRALQMRVNGRTKRYSKLIEGEQAEAPELVEALRRLAEREERIYQITHDLEMGKNR